MRVLIVDDAASERVYLIAMLKRLGIDKIVQVENGSKALTLLKKDKDFDMILIDWNMPVMTGTEAISVLNFQGNKIPIVMMSGRDRPEDIERVLQMGAHAYLMKPFTIDHLAEKINLVIKHTIEEEAT
jgi:CheY-like chemotaxis protein